MNIQIKNYLAGFDLSSPLTFDQYKALVGRAGELWGSEVQRFLMDCFMPTGEPIEPGYEDSLSHYVFTPTWEELEKDYEDSL